MHATAPVLFPHRRFHAVRSPQRVTSAIALTVVLILSSCGGFEEASPRARVVLSATSPTHTSTTRPALPTGALRRRKVQRQLFARWLQGLALHAWIEAVTAAGEKACGGDLPPCYVCERESHCTWRAFNPTGCGGRSCFGKWQWDPTTWDTQARRMGRVDLVGQYFPRNPLDQNAVAAFTWDHGRGCGHWAACG